MKLTKSSEDYLEAVLRLQNQRGIVRSVDVANILGYSKPSVSIAVKKLKDDGYLTMDSDKTIYLTDVGKNLAEKIYERHRLLTSCFISLGVEPVQAEKDACRVEHSISDTSFEKIKNIVQKCERFANIYQNA